MIREKYIHGNRDDINRYNMYCESTTFFRNELESLDYYSRKYDDAIFFNESAEEIELIEESVTDIIRTIGNKIIEIIKKVRDFIKNIFQKIKTASWEGKSDERKLELLAKKNPDLAKRANVERRVYPHLFRKTTASNIVKRGGSMHDAGEYLGHKDRSTAGKHYAFVSEEHTIDIFNKYVAAI